MNYYDTLRRRRQDLEFERFKKGLSNSVQIYRQETNGSHKEKGEKSERVFGWRRAHTKMTPHPAYDIKTCIVCHKDYYAFKIKIYGKKRPRTSRTIRMYSSLTCSKICARDYIRHRWRIISLNKKWLNEKNDK